MNSTSPRDWCAYALATFTADSSPNPFNQRAERLEGDAAYIELIFQVEAELRAKIRQTPAHFVEAALSLALAKPPDEWKGWSAFNGDDDWDHALGIMLGEFARLHPDRFFEKAEPLLDNPATRAAIIEAVGGATSYESTPKQPFKDGLAPFINDPSNLGAEEIWQVEDLLTGEEKEAFRARLSGEQLAELRNLKRSFGVN